jgi:hypothetical protein
MTGAAAAQHDPRWGAKLKEEACASAMTDVDTMRAAWRRDTSEDHAEQLL